MYGHHSFHLVHHTGCSPSCKNGGTCSSGVCRCAPWYTGSYCQRSSSSSSFSSSSSTSSEYKCVCGHVWLHVCVCCMHDSKCVPFTHHMLMHTCMGHMKVARYSAYIRIGMSVWVCIHRVCACASGKVGHVHSCVYAYI